MYTPSRTHTLIHWLTQTIPPSSGPLPSLIPHSLSLALGIVPATPCLPPFLSLPLLRWTYVNSIHTKQSLTMLRLLDSVIEECAGMLLFPDPLPVRQCSTQTAPMAGGVVQAELTSPVWEI